jgi:predicted enzyme related to lactoylglutathione lyase
LPDPDGNEIELAADRPRQEWPDPSEFGGGPRPLDLPGLLALVGDEPSHQADEELRVGHVHLHVGDVEQALAFYVRALGFELRMRMPTAAFTSVGGYHHQLAFNTWRGEGVPPAPEGAVGLRHWTVVLEEATEVDAVAARAAEAGYASTERRDGVLLRDPWGIAVLLRTAPHPRPRSLASVETTSPSQYLLAAADRLRGELEVSFDSRAATIRFPAGRAELHAEPGRLVVEVIAAKEGDLAGLEAAITRELVRVAAAELPELAWRRSRARV